MDYIAERKRYIQMKQWHCSPDVIANQRALLKSLRPDYNLID